MTLKQERFLKTQKPLYLKIKTCSLKDTIKRAKTKATEWEKISAIHLRQMISIQNKYITLMK